MTDSRKPDRGAFCLPAELPPNAELPDPFVRPDGHRISTRRQWPRQRAALLRQILHYEYGALPPVPQCVRVQSIRTKARPSIGALERTLRVSAGTRRHPVAIDVVLTLPARRSPSRSFPVIVRGDLGWAPVNPDIAAAVVERGYVLAEFDREQVAADGPAADGVYLAFPEFDGGRIAAWAWGFHRVVDALTRLRFVDHARIAVTGHSRGGKAALLAGAIDARIALTAPNNSGCGGAGCFRVLGPGSEDVAAITTTFPYWFHHRLRDFVGAIERLPFDQHSLKALVAPRALLSTEALDDLWANPLGTRCTHAAAKEVFEFLGAGQRIGIRFRDGGHQHNEHDWAALLDFADWQLFGVAPFDARPPASQAKPWTWRAPSA